QGAVRLPAKLHPCEFDHRRAHPSVALFSDPLLAFGAAAQNGVPPSPTYPPSARRLRNCRTNASRTRRVAMSGPIDRKAVREPIILSASSAALPSQNGVTLRFHPFNQLQKRDRVDRAAV